MRKRWIVSGAQHPKVIVIVDCIGAGVSALLLWLLARHAPDILGLPGPVIGGLSALAFLLFLSSGACCLFVTCGWKTLLKGLAMANLGYVLWTLWIVGSHLGQMRVPGLVYFSGELGIVGFLSHLEWRISQYKA